MRTNMFITLLFTLIFFIDSASAEKTTSSLNRCRSTSDKTEVTIKTIDQGFRINNQFTSRYLNTKSRSSLAGDYVIGLTSLESRTTTDVQGHVWDDDITGGECFAAKIKIQIIYEPIEVFIGREFKEGTCTYRTILEHEMEHVNLYLESLAKIELSIKDLMAQRFQEKPLYATKGKAIQMLENELDNLWRPLIKAELTKVQIKQNAIDSEEKINEVTWSCLGEIQSKFGFRYN